MASFTSSFALSYLLYVCSALEDPPPVIYDSLVKKAVSFNMKIWSIAKLESVLDRCLISATPSSRASAILAPVPSTQRSLSRLLESERLHGTSERDPTQKRHDFRYFSKNSYFILVEDIRQELATIHALEYPISKTRDGKEYGTWPKLYCHPKARGPFIKYDERETKRAMRLEKQEQERAEEKQRRKAKLRERERLKKMEAQRILAKRSGDLRRSVSMVNLRNDASRAEDALPGMIDFDGEMGGDGLESANASGYLASGAYMAASGNSVSIT